MPSDLVIRQSDVLPTLTSSITDANGNPLNITGATVSLAMRAMPSNTQLTLQGTASVTNGPNGSVQYVWNSADTATPGLYMAEWHITLSGGNTYTWPNNGYLSIEVAENLTTPGGSTLVSLADAKDYLNIPASDRSRDTKVLRWINAVQPIVESITGPILQRTYEEWHDGGQYFIRLRRRPSTGYGTNPVLYLQACSEYRGPIEYTLSIIQDPAHGNIYSCMADTKGFVYRRTSGGGVIAFPAMPRSVHVWYTAGQSSVPANVYEGTLELLRENFQQTQQGRPRANQQAYLTDDVEPTGPPIGYFVPRRVREMLAPTRRAPAVA